MLDKLTYAGNEANLAPGPRRPGAGRPPDASSAATSPTRRWSGRSSPTADAVVNFAAESHVDRSILDPEAFLRTGVIGVHVLLEACRGRRPGRPRFLQVSTDEVYGSCRRGPRAPRTRRSLRARRTRRPRRPASCSSAATSSPTASMRSSPAARTPTARTTTPRSSSRCSSPTPSTTCRCRSTATASSDATGCTWPTTPAAIDFVLRHGASGETYNVPGGAERTNRDVVAAAARAARQAVVARSRGRGPARPRPPLRDGRHEAGGARLATEHAVRGRPGRDDRLVPGQRGLVAGGPVGRLGRLVRAPVRPAPGDEPGRVGRRAPGRLMRVAVTGATGRLGRGARRGPRRRAVHRSGRPDRLGPRRLRPRRIPRRSASASIATGPRSSSTRPPGPTSTAARSTRSSPCAATATATGRARARPAPPAAIDSLAISTNEVFDGAPDRRARLPARRPAGARQPVRRLEAGGRAAGDGRLSRRDAAAASASSAPPGCSGARGATSRAGSWTPPSGPRASRRAAAGRRRRVGDADLHRTTWPRRSSSCWPRTRVGRDPPPRQRPVSPRRADWARDVLARAGVDGRRRGRPDGDLAAPVAGRRAGGSWRRRRCRPASRSGRGRTAMADYAPTLLRAARARA